MALEVSTLVRIEELGGATELNGAFEPYQLLRSIYCLLPYKVLSLEDPVRHRVILVQIEDLTVVNGVLFGYAHRLKLAWHEIWDGHLLDLELSNVGKLTGVQNPIQHMD